MEKRLIDANKLIQDVEKLLYKGNPIVAFIQKQVDKQPAIDAMPKWIPCEDRLPKKERATYLICTESGYMCSCRWTNDMYGLGSYEWSEWGWHIMDKPQYAKVVAWMEMKPWEGADDED